jgi:vitamin B12 transporter
VLPHGVAPRPCPVLTRLLVVVAMLGASSALAFPDGGVEPLASPLRTTVRAARAGSEVRSTAEAVTVVDLVRAATQAADLGEVLARAPGVAVQRTGALGSDARLSLNGLSGDAVRVFVDEVPLDQAGFPFGVANVPVGLLERVDVYRGVVPLRFGADALGGVMHLVMRQPRTSELSASYQVGSFGTHRVMTTARLVSQSLRLWAAGTAFFDVARNDYPIEVEVADGQGRVERARVTRFHDGYLAGGGWLEVGAFDHPLARRVSLRGFLSGFSRQLQHNPAMTIPYGEVTSRETAFGATLRYEQPLSSRFSVDLLATASSRTISFLDVAEFVYDWRGQQVAPRVVPGELGQPPSDVTQQQLGFLGRVQSRFSPLEGHLFTVSASPSFVRRAGVNRRWSGSGPDPLTTPRTLLNLVSGIEYAVDALPSDQGPGLRNLAFVKSYLSDVTASAVGFGGSTPLERAVGHRFGLGDSLRWQVSPALSLKAAYEFATRLPTADERFGNGALVLPNLSLEPEVSHNLNLGPRFEARRTAAGDFSLDVNAFWRESEHLIALLGNETFFAFQNVFSARSLGVEGAATWTSPGRHLGADLSVTWQDVRNTSREGAFQSFRGDRLPNLPWLFGSLGLRGRLAGLPDASDTLEPFYFARWALPFFRGWESQGALDSKQVIPGQLVHTVGITYSLVRPTFKVSTTIELQNVFDATVFDVFGAQRPGRAFFLKIGGGV